MNIAPRKAELKKKFNKSYELGMINFDVQNTSELVLWCSSVLYSKIIIASVPREIYTERRKKRRVPHAQ